jgi:hypothetical protein
MSVLNNKCRRIVYTPSIGGYNKSLLDKWQIVAYNVLMLKVAVVSVFGNSLTNLVLAKEYCKYVLEKGNAPFASHVFYSSLLDDAIPEERDLGMEAGKAFIRTCDEMWVFLVKSVFSKGMVEEVLLAKSLGMVIRYFDATDFNNIKEYVADSLELEILDIAFAICCGEDRAFYLDRLNVLLNMELKERDLEAETFFEENKHV